MPPCLVIRADASAEIGYGHVQRTLALAEAVVQNGGKAAYICAELPDALDTRLTEEFGIEIVRIPREEFANADVAIQSLRGIAERWQSAPTLVVVDHYKLESSYEKAIRKAGYKLLAIDDAADRYHDCDYFLNQNLVSDPSTFERVAPADAKVFLGPAFSMIRSEFHLAPEGRRYDGPAKKLLVFLGGGVWPDAVRTCIAALASFPSDRFEITMVMGTGDAEFQAAQSQAAQAGLRIEFLRNVSDMAQRLQNADLCLGSAGVNTWERACLGLPAICIGVAPNQYPIGEEMARRGAIVYLGPAENLSSEQIAAEIRRVADDPETLQRMSTIGRETVDGRGVERLFRNISAPAKKIRCVSDKKSWIHPYVADIATRLRLEGHRVNVGHSQDEVEGEDIVFYLSWSKITPPEILRRSKHNIVIHESDLPKGKGMSPTTWQILEGKNDFVVSMLEAEESVDSGPVYIKKWVHFNGTELIDEIRDVVGRVSVDFALAFIHDQEELVANRWTQTGEESFYGFRRPGDSRLDPEETIAEQFNLLRVVDNERYPAFFDYRGRRYILKIMPDERDLKL